MPSNKTLTIFILCLGVVISVWFVTNKQKRLSQNTARKPLKNMEDLKDFI
jgi:hypothetical protein